MTIKDIEWYEWIYKIDIHWNIYNNKWLILRPYIYKTWYNRVMLYKDKIWKNYLIHRLVWLHFIDNINNYLQINHIDWNKSNNNVENLEWCTAKQNQIHSRKILWNFIGDKNPMYWKFWVLNHKSKSINQYTLWLEFIRTRECAEDIKRKLWIDQSCVIKCCRWKRNKTWWFKRTYS